jgi:hypothetical protein
LNQTEDGGVCADTKPEDQNRGDGESGRLQKQAEGVAKVGHGANVRSDW